MGYQFAHIYTYSGSGGKEGKFKVSGCLGEAFRDEGYTKHIEKPDKNVGLLYGDREALEKSIKDYQKDFRDPRGHKLRKDGKCLLAGVFSWPPGTTKDDFVTGNVYLKSWLLKEYGASLRCVLTHEDEPFQRGSHKDTPHYHTHFFAVPEASQDIKELHQGLKAKKEARTAGRGILEQDKAYKWAMGDWQDKIHRELGVQLGFERARPEALREKRLSRREQKIIEKAEENARQIEVSAKEAEAQSVSVLQTAEMRLAVVEKREAAITAREKTLKEIAADFERVMGITPKEVAELKTKYDKWTPADLEQTARYMRQSGAANYGEYRKIMENKKEQQQNRGIKR